MSRGHYYKNTSPQNALQTTDTTTLIKQQPFFSQSNLSLICDIVWSWNEGSVKQHTVTVGYQEMFDGGCWKKADKLYGLDERLCGL